MLVVWLVAWSDVRRLTVPPREVGVVGLSLASSQGSLVLADARAGKLRGRRLYVFRLDRLTRTGIADTLTTIEELRTNGVEVLSVADGFDLIVEATSARTIESVSLTGTGVSDPIELVGRTSAVVSDPIGWPDCSHPTELGGSTFGAERPDGVAPWAALVSSGNEPNHEHPNCTQAVSVTPEPEHPRCGSRRVLIRQASPKRRPAERPR